MDRGQIRPLKPYDATHAALFRPGFAEDHFAIVDPNNIAALMAEMARLAYNEDAGVRAARLAAIGFREHRVFLCGATKAFLLVSDDVAVLSFRGTGRRVYTNLIDNMLIPLRPWRAGGRAHAGFARALERAWPEIHAALQRLDLPLYVTGHSLGAALATLAASLTPARALYTFGGPRVGDAGFAEALAGLEIHRFVHCRDLVCRVPWVWLGYRHVCHRRYINRHGEVTNDGSRASVAADRARAGPAARRRAGAEAVELRFRSLTDHAPINYTYALV